LQTQSKFRLLVVRLGAMGDILHALPAITALRQAHPTWVIDWLVEPRWRALLAADDSSTRGDHCACATPNPAQPVVDAIHLAPTKQWRKAPLSRQTLCEIKTLRRNLRESHYDVTLDLQGNLRSAILAALARSRRIGEETPREQAAAWFYHDHIRTTGAHVIEQDLELASAIAGDDFQPLRPWLPVDLAAQSWADQFLPSSSPPAVLINPGAGWGAKRWPVERYAAVAQGMIARGFHVVVNAGPGEEPLAQSIVDATSGAAQVVSGSLAHLIALTRRMTLAIAGDTGPLHLACALGIPVVGIYGPTDPSRNGPFGTIFRVLRSPESRRDHSRLPDPEAGLLTIQPDAVLQAAGQVLQTAHPLLYPEETPIGNSEKA
jgi:heptosyltransferase-1